MKRYNDFIKYLEGNWADSTAYKYSRAIHTISNELFNHELIEYDIYLIDNNDVINNLVDIYLSIPELNEKDRRGNRMYSNAIKRYIEFYNSNNQGSKIKEEDEAYASYIIDKPKPKLSIVEITPSERVIRDSLISANVIINSSYCCEYNDSHRFFISNVTGKNYVEAHHIIPLKAHNDFSYSLDVEANIASLCVVCHKLLHHGTMKDKMDIIVKLYEDRKERLKNCKIAIEFEKLIEYYR